MKQRKNTEGIMKKEKVRKKKRIFQTCVRVMYSHWHAAKYVRHLWHMQLTDALINGVYTNLHFITAAH